MKSNLIIAGDDLNCSKKIYNTIKMKNLDKRYAFYIF